MDASYSAIHPPLGTAVPAQSSSSPLHLILLTSSEEAEEEKKTTSIALVKGCFLLHTHPFYLYSGIFTQINGLAGPVNCKPTTQSCDDDDFPSPQQTWTDVYSRACVWDRKTRQTPKETEASAHDRDQQFSPHALQTAKTILWYPVIQRRTPSLEAPSTYDLLPQIVEALRDGATKKRLPFISWVVSSPWEDKNNSHIHRFVAAR